MIRRFVSAVIIAALACTLGGAPAFADTPHKADGPGRVVSPPNSSAKVPQEAGSGGRLKADMLKLVADAEAGKLGASVPRLSQQPAMSNSLSKGQKIAIGVGIAAAIIVTVVVVKATCDGMC